MRSCIRIRRWTITTLLALCAFSGSALALEPSEVALVCNTQVPASPELAAFYARTRGVPADNIIELSLPSGEQMSAERFDPDVVRPIRNALEERGLARKIKCIVTFYGVPLKLAPRNNSEAEKTELAQLQLQAADTEKEITSAVTALEDAVIRQDPGYRPQSAIDLIGMLKRSETAFLRAQELMRETSDVLVRRHLEAAMLENIRQLGGPSAIVQHARPTMLRSLQASTSPASSQPAAQLDPREMWDLLKAEVEKAKDQVPKLTAERDKIESRRRLRELTAQNLGLVDLLRLVQIQIDYLTPEAMTSLDSELSLLWYDAYTHKNFLPNPLHYLDKNRGSSRAVMVMRLDGPQSGTARDIFLAARSVEQQGGLAGRFAIDSRGLVGRKADGQVDNYGVFDERLRELAKLLQRATKLPIVLDASGDVFKPGSVDDVALYCGWYSVRNYVPGFSFKPGAIGYHIGSFEMVSLRGEQEKGWVRGMLNDGISSTLGPVDEPYLLAFPDPMDFFPLLLTGKYTLAETYWLTLPVVSWKMSIIGDPLYRPFAENAPLKTEDLPPRLQTFVAPEPLSPSTGGDHLPGYRGF